jgi:hypothetical protein
MSTRSIVTSQPDVACDVCERRLLRGEQPDTFLAAGEPRIVCELCAPRAAHQGWKRGSADQLASPAPLRHGRRHALLGRLRQARRTPGGDARGSASAEGLSAEGPEPYDFLDAGRLDARAPGGGAVLGAGAEAFEPAPAAREAGPLQQAVDLFNTSEYPRRVASLTRSLGAPEVTVRPGEAVASAVVIVLAWELCWYAYEVNLDDMQGPQAQPLAQGTELSELPAGDRLANGIADERGMLAVP